MVRVKENNSTDLDPFKENNFAELDPSRGGHSAEIQENYSNGAVIIAIARQWIGTPYHHQASLQGVGCDCLGLVRGVYRVMVGPEPPGLPNYSPDWDEVAKRDEMLSLFTVHLAAIPSDRREPGDVIAFRMRPGAAAKHCGIVTEGGRFIHSHSGIGVVEIELNAWWQRRIAAMFAFPGGM